MNEIIKPLKKLPAHIKLGGDYNSTQYALLLSLLSEGDICIRNYNQGKDTSLTLEFLDSIGCLAEKSATEIIIKPESTIEIEECAELKYHGGAVPLSLIISYIAGKNICCSLNYSKTINPDFIDLLVSTFSSHGIDLFHKAEINQIYFRSSTESFIECTFSFALPYIKNCFLFYCLTRRQSLAIKETITTDSRFEKMIADFGGSLSLEETKSEMIVNPDDPRKKIRIENFDYKRKIELRKSSIIKGGEISVPSDFHSLAAFMLLAVLKKASLSIEDVHLDYCMNRYIKLLKSFTADIELSNKKRLDNYSTATLTIFGREAKGRKLSGLTAGQLMLLTPYIAIAAAVGKSNSVIRDISEYAIWQNNPFNEIIFALKNLDIKSGALEDGLVIEARSEYEEDKYGPFHNKETALAFYMLTLAENIKSTFEGFEMVSDNYPEVVEAVHLAYENQLLARST